MTLSVSRLAATSAFAAILALATVADASAYTRSGSVSGPRGVSTVNGSGSCSGGSCSRSVVRTGPAGNSYTRSGSASCSGGTCSGSATSTGPRGYSRTRQGSVSRY